MTITNRNAGLNLGEANSLLCHLKGNSTSSPLAIARENLPSSWRSRRERVGPHADQMSFTAPPNSEILAAFTKLSSLDPLDSGGFKAVYKASIGGKLEIFKLVCLPSAGETEEQQSYRHESIGRIRREVELLGRCQAPELVKLGSLAPSVISIGGTEYVGYSEEFLDGPNLCSMPT
jgi:hypothetical protein